MNEATRQLTVVGRVENDAHGHPPWAAFLKDSLCALRRHIPEQLTQPFGHCQMCYHCIAKLVIWKLREHCCLYYYVTLPVFIRF